MLRLSGRENGEREAVKWSRDLIESGHFQGSSGSPGVVYLTVSP